MIETDSQSEETARAEAGNPAVVPLPETTAPVAAPEETTAPDSPAASVLGESARRSLNRRRRHNKPPKWALRLAQRTGSLREFIRDEIADWLHANRAELISYVGSTVFLVMVAGAMAFWAMPPEARDDVFAMLVTRLEYDDAPMEMVEVLPEEPPKVLEDFGVASNMAELTSNFDAGESLLEVDSIPDKEFATDLVPTESEIKQVMRLGEFGGRSKAGRRVAVHKYGGTVNSERAVNTGLAWLQKIQQEDGSWNFSKVGQGARAGSFRRTEVGATSMALLCFLGGGHTHAEDGAYKDVVRRGLAFIGKEATIQQGTADLRGSYESNSGMYVHALATICISEARALARRDRDLTKLTEMAVSFIEAAQDPTSGGWRYKPRDDTSDTSVVGWQVMAMQSAKAGGIRFPSKSLRLARDYLKDAQTDEDGAFYSYQPGGGRKPAMTAVGLLCRMYMGWKRDNEGLRKGVSRLSSIGPSKTDIYYNYYAAQVLHHWGGDEWKRWNEEATRSPGQRSDYRRPRQRKLAGYQ